MRSAVFRWVRNEAGPPLQMVELPAMKQEVVAREIRLPAAVLEASQSVVGEQSVVVGVVEEIDYVMAGENLHWVA